MALSLLLLVGLCGLVASGPENGPVVAVADSYAGNGTVSGARFNSSSFNLTAPSNTTGVVNGSAVQNMTSAENATGLANMTVGENATGLANTTVGENTTTAASNTTLPVVANGADLIRQEQHKQDASMRISAMARRHHNTTDSAADTQPDEATAPPPIVQIVLPQGIPAPQDPTPPPVVSLPAQPVQATEFEGVKPRLAYADDVAPSQRAVTPMIAVLHQAQAQTRYQDTSDSLDPNSLSSSSDSSGSSSGFLTSSDSSGSSESSSSSSPSSAAPPKDAPGGSPTELSQFSSGCFESSSSSTSSMDSSTSSSESSQQLSGSVDSLGSVSETSSDSSESSNPTVSVLTSFTSSVTSEMMQQTNVLASSS